MTSYSMKNPCEGGVHSIKIYLTETATKFLKKTVVSSFSRIFTRAQRTHAKGEKITSSLQPVNQT